jgi:hypothetical protein
MPAWRWVAIVAVAVVAGVVVAVVRSCGGGSSAAVAHVGAEPVTKTQLQGSVDHFANEAAAEGKPFPRPGTAVYRTVERQALGLLVYRSELEQSATKLGVPVTRAQVQQRLGRSAETEGDVSDQRFAESTIRSQIAYEHIYAKVTAGIPAARRQRAMQRWLDRMKLTYEVSYEPGYAAPGS